MYAGTFPIDKLSKIPEKPISAVIINTAPSTHQGKHWVAAIKLNGKQEFFDSYGLPPCEEIHRFLSKRGQYKFNTKQTQGVFSTTCGAHCIFYLYYHSKGFTMEEIVKQANDKSVIDFINRLHSPDEDFSELLNQMKANQSSEMLFQFV